MSAVRSSISIRSVSGCVALTILASCFLLVSTQARASDKSNAQAWVQRCGGASPEDMRTRRVQGIFERVKRASDARGKQSKLFILECDGWPWAATLQDRNIILTRGAMEAIYGSDDPIKSKDARLAFVLGHELKHVLEDDFWHEQVRRQQFMASKSLLSYGEQTKESRRRDEQRADEDGFIYASLAGFDTADIFRPVRGEDSFLDDWARQTSTLSGDTHLSPSERTEHLNQKFHSLNNAVELFKHGVRLAYFGRYSEARILLEDFQNVYPSAAVLNNLGYVYLQMARQQMPPELAYRYWYPMLIDLDSGVPPSISRNTGTYELPVKARDLLNSAVKLLESSLDQYGDSKVAINLVTALMYLGDFSAAQATLETVDDWQQDPQLIGLDALAVMHDSRLKDPWNTYAREKFEQVASNAKAADNLIFNYAKLLTETGRNELAWVYLMRLSERLNKLPVDYRVMVCRELRKRQAAACASAQDKIENTTHWILEIKPGDDIDAIAVREKLKDWQTPIKDKLDGIDATVYQHASGNSLLALNGIVEVISVKRHGYDFKDHLISDNGEPQSEVQTLAGDLLLSYGKNWSALVRGSEVREIWIAR